MCTFVPIEQIKEEFQICEHEKLYIEMKKDQDRLKKELNKCEEITKSLFDKIQECYNKMKSK